MKIRMLALGLLSAIYVTFFILPLFCVRAAQCGKATRLYAIVNR